MSTEPNRPTDPQTPPEEARDPTGRDADQEQSQERPRRILIGSQRDPAAYRSRPKRDWVTGGEQDAEAGQPDKQAPVPQEKPEAQPPAETRPVETPPTTETPTTTPPVESALPAEQAIGAPRPSDPEAPSPPVAPLETAAPSGKTAPGPAPRAEDAATTEPEAPREPPASGQEAAPAEPAAAEQQGATEGAAEAPSRDDRRGKRGEKKPKGPRIDPEWLPRKKQLPVPNLRRDLPSDLAEEYEQALGDASLEELLEAPGAGAPAASLEPDSRHKGRIVHVHNEDVFVELGGREQGVVPLRQFPEPPAEGAEIEVVVTRFNAEDGLYELSLPSMAAAVEDWSDLSEGMLVEARVTGHNSGGLECDVNHIRGFIPVSQIALYRVEDLSEFVDQKFNCLITECNAQRGNLVLSRRAVLEREKEIARQELMESLAPGEVREGVVRKLMDFGAFVDLGSGVDGLLHVSQLSWARVEHPREILQEGQTIEVRVERVDKTTGRISLGYRELQENPWSKAASRWPPNSMLKGRVVKLMDFGAFVEVEPGVEGLVHISELSHKRVWRTSDVVSEGDEVEVVVLSVDADAQRMSLSMRQALPAPEKSKKDDSDEPSEGGPLPRKMRQKSDQPLKGGLGTSSGGDRFGLKW